LRCADSITHKFRRHALCSPITRVIAVENVGGFICICSILSVVRCLANGTGKTLGLLPALAALGAPIVTAAGSAGNTGGSETGASSLGSADFQSAYSSLNAAYLASPKCAWLMNHATFATITGKVDKYGIS
jgi:hypothetical protein